MRRHFGSDKAESDCFGICSKGDRLTAGAGKAEHKRVDVHEVYSLTERKSSVSSTFPLIPRAPLPSIKHHIRHLLPFPSAAVSLSMSPPKL